MTRVHLTGKQQLERVGDARREAIYRKNNVQPYDHAPAVQLKYKPHLRMHASRLVFEKESPLRTWSIEWVKPMPDGRVTYVMLCAEWGRITPAGWQNVRDRTTPNHMTHRELLNAGHLSAYKFNPPWKL